MRIFKVLFLPFLIFLVSCSSDDDNQTSSTIDITGNWEVSGMEGEGEATGEFNGMPVTVPFEMLGKEFDAQVVFTENPNEIIPSGTLVLEITVSFFGFPETTEELVDFSEVFTPASSWSIQGNNLTFETEGQVQTAEIVSLTQNMMVLLLDQTNEVMGFEGTGTIEVTLER